VYTLRGDDADLLKTGRGGESGRKLAGKGNRNTVSVEKEGRGRWVSHGN